MSYRISYINAKHTHIKRKRPILRYIAISCLALSVFLCLCFSDKLEAIRTHAFPFLQPQVKSAFSEMLTNIHAGADIKDAATVFCKEIIGEYTALDQN